MSQDWNVVTFKKKNPNNKGPKKTATKSTGGDAPKKKTTLTAKKIEEIIDEGEGSMKIETVDIEFRLKLQRARQSKGWTQKELASKIAEKITVINEYENGSAIPSNQVISKLEKALGVRLR
eukprot:TRINITY_DN4880_c0_g1_i1.p1 TRINITY_DN4880_c0_g1~~TRINITY_DN4880_c0_g1_i1.p1  ORF type:complete len:121 (+),score=45.50 TRINITY_DN4880_c0_g1_i1:94-456(+)